MTDLLSMLKNGSLIGYFVLPQHAKCYKIWGHPLESSGKVLKIVAKVLSGSFDSRW